MEMLRHMHLAAQYLAMAGKSFLKAKADDSHTNLSFVKDENQLQTRELDNSGNKLCLDYERYGLLWSNSEDFIGLEGNSHASILQWLQETSNKMGLKPYSYQLHYKLPYTIDSGFVFGPPDMEQINKLIEFRSLAQDAIQSFLNAQHLKSEIRVWPHHFDTGAFSALNNGSGKSIGLGMATPDAIVDDFYFYLSGYRGLNNLNTWAFNRLSQGKWVNDNFKGAVLAASGVTKNQVTQFFSEALDGYMR